MRKLFLFLLAFNVRASSSADARRPLIYLSTDVETDGPLPGPNSMWSLASVAYTADKKILGQFSVNLADLPGAKPSEKTMAFWNRPENANALKAARENPQVPAKAIKDYVAWVKNLPGDPVFVAYPLAFDSMFVLWYTLYFAGENPFKAGSLDIKSYSAGMLKADFRDLSLDKYPERWFDPLPHTHIALDDALEQGAFFINMLQENEQSCWNLLATRFKNWVRTSSQKN
jgi:hypothetical protein